MVEALRPLRFFRVAGALEVRLSEVGGLEVRPRKGGALLEPVAGRPTNRTGIDARIREFRDFWEGARARTRVRAKTCSGVLARDGKSNRQIALPKSAGNPPPSSASCAARITSAARSRSSTRAYGTQLKRRWRRGGSGLPRAETQQRGPAKSFWVVNQIAVVGCV